MTKRALIYGICGQDGSYLAELLLSKGYEVWGVIRRHSNCTSNTERINHILGQLHLVYGDITDAMNVMSTIQECKPDEVYNLAAMSHVGISFNLEKYTTDVDALGCLNVLQALRLCGLASTCKYYQASTSEMFGNSMNTHGIEKLSMASPLNPVSPYAIAKLYAHHMVKHYRKAYGMFAVSSILFNHESPRRGENFVTRKIVLWAKAFAESMKAGTVAKELHIGNMDSTRDWGHAKDYVYGIWLIMNQSVADNCLPKDYVLATGEQVKVRTFIEKVCTKIGWTIEWQGTGVEERGYINGVCAVVVDPKYFRPNELTDLRGDASEAEQELGWTREYTLDGLIDDMLKE